MANSGWFCGKYSDLVQDRKQPNNSAYHCSNPGEDTRKSRPKGLLVVHGYSPYANCGEPYLPGSGSRGPFSLPSFRGLSGVGYCKFSSFEKVKLPALVEGESLDSLPGSTPFFNSSCSSFPSRARRGRRLTGGIQIPSGSQEMDLSDSIRRR